MSDNLIELIIDGFRNCTKPHEVCSELDLEAFAEHLIAHGVTVQEWIPVSERLPEDSGYYLVVYRDKYNGSISIAFDMYVKCKAGEWWENDFMRDVTHWMPLPEAPKEVE